MGRTPGGGNRIERKDSNVTTDEHTKGTLTPAQGKIEEGVGTLTGSRRPGMGAVPYPGGTTFRVWAPHAEAVAVRGAFDEWSPGGVALERDDDGAAGTWSADVPGVGAGTEYRFAIRTTTDELSRLDPYAREVTSSVGNGVVHDPAAFDWGEATFQMPDWNTLVIYEMHVGTFAGRGATPGDFDRAITRMPYLAELGIGAVQVMPPFEHAGDVSWGYNPANLFAIESSYGGPDAFKRFVKSAHDVGIAVILDVVYNHLGPSDLDLWRFDGWAEGEWGGIYFYNDARAVTPWGNTRPDFGRGEVRTFLKDSALTWLDRFRVDGLRFDSTLYIRTVDGSESTALPDGWSFLAWLNDEIRAWQPWKLTIAEDLQGNGRLTAGTAAGGAGFGSQWESSFLQTVRHALTVPDDADRDVGAVAAAIAGGGDQPFARVIYTESHDDVANGRSRLPEEIAPGDAGNWFAKKRATLGSALTLTSPGIPMLFQGQELLEDRWFDDTRPIDWSKAHRNAGILHLHTDLVALRRNAHGWSAGLTGPHVAILRADQESRLLACHRWLDGGPGDDVIVVANLGAEALDDVAIGFPRGGRWRVRLNSDSRDYDATFGDHLAVDLDADGPPLDGQSQSGLVHVGPYSVVIFSQDR
jgi:1,4-alpha-glucan branching enzyme